MSERRGLRVARAVLIPLFVLAMASPSPAEDAAEPADGGPTLQQILEKLPFGLHGFVEARGGLRTRGDAHVARTATVGETRLQLELSKVFDFAEFRLKSDSYYDGVLGRGLTDVREAYVLASPFGFMDLKAGRQILTWGTGDFLFINDLFPKDYASFFTGRDDEYLKAPSDAVKASFFTDLASLDVVYTARFQPDRYVTGERLSYYNDLLGRLAGEDDPVRDIVPDGWFRDDELAARLYKNFSGYEVALYGFYGYWPSPAGVEPLSGKLTFPRLSVYGGSVRGPVLKGIGNVEVGYYDSRDDRGGDDPLVRNSEFRALVGYEQEIARNFTAGAQYYIEWMMHYDAYKDTLPPGIHARDEVRHLVTLRLTRLLMSQNLKLSLFTFYSPSDADAYLRPKAHYKISDSWAAEAGANIFLGAHDYTAFGQLEDDTNVYAGVRYSF